MVYLLIAIAFLMIAAPIVAVLPSKRDKARMVKRRAAMSRGISVGMTTLEDPDPDPEKYLSSTGKPMERKLAVASYRIGRRQPSGDDNEYAAVKWAALGYPLRKHEAISKRFVWEEPPHDISMGTLVAFLSANLDLLPTDVVRVEEKNKFISVYWQEDGEVQEVIDFLERCSQVWPAKIDPETNLLDRPNE